MATPHALPPVGPTTQYQYGRPRSNPHDATETVQANFKPKPKSTDISHLTNVSTFANANFQSDFHDQISSVDSQSNCLDCPLAKPFPPVQDLGHVDAKGMPGTIKNRVPAIYPSRNSRFTEYLLIRLHNWPLLHGVLADKDSRRIFYFTCLNFAFMLVQTFYGVVTGSLGLLSDSIHMFFDCIALAVGLAAAIMSKWPPSQRFPYGYGKVDSLAGFGNGVFLMLISIEIVTEAVERLYDGSQLRRIGELLTVSSLGLCVNLVGMLSFGHHHHGHSHNHSHGGDIHQKVCNHNHNPSLSDPNSPLHAQSNLKSQSHNGHSRVDKHPGLHHHSNDNMHGIFLHIMADTLGSVAVVISTLLIHYFSWPGFDPLASCIIAILIFAAALPLVISSAKTLLLALPPDTEYLLRDTLGGISELRGVVNYSVPKFWLGDSSIEKHKESSHSSNKPHTRGPSILGVIHIIASRSAEAEDVRTCVELYLKDRGFDVVIQVEREKEGRCWCGVGSYSK
ncbi:MAG: putative zinc transporter msc2 [Trizodia sp. TS-e1964]|nr:MAG: putative zinc transporter msc2 [Trizodia sp. TS-e1964]